MSAISAIEKLYTPNSIYTYSGRLIDVTNLKVEDIFPEDIAFGLARECRFGNHTKKFWSVAEHSMWCMLHGQVLYPGDNALHLRLLMHDAHEAYLGDWCTPIIDSIDGIYPGVKSALNTIKKLVQHPINTRFGIGLCPMECEKVKQIDRMALEWEWQNKVTHWTEMNYLGDVLVAEMWLDYFKKLVKVPTVISAAAQ
jgi:hypothetical protein